MGAYLIRRLLLVIPTLWAIITINFFHRANCALAVRSTVPSPPLSLVMPEYYPAQAVKVFVPAMRKRVSAISATVITVADAD